MRSVITTGEQEVKTLVGPAIHPLSRVFERGVKLFPGISVSAAKKAGAPCIAGSRIPIFMVLDAVQTQVNLEGVRTSYPDLSIEQIKEAIGFARFVVESPIDDESAVAS